MSGLVLTSVTVTNPILGSFSPFASSPASTSLIAASIRLILRLPMADPLVTIRLPTAGSLNQLPLDGLDLVDLEPVPDPQVLEVLQDDPALHPARHLLDVVVEPAQARHRGVGDNRAVPDHPHLRAAPDRSLLDVTAGDRPHPRGLEQ